LTLGLGLALGSVLGLGLGSVLGCVCDWAWCRGWGGVWVCRVWGRFEVWLGSGFGLWVLALGLVFGVGLGVGLWV